MWTLYKIAESQFWTAEDHALDIPSTDGPSTNEELCEMLAGLLTLNSRSTLDDLAIAVPYLEAKVFLNYQAAMRNIHSETYMMILNVYIPVANTKKRNTLLNAAEKSNKKNREWIQATVTGQPDIRTKLVGVACCESLMLRSFTQRITNEGSCAIPENVASALKFIERDKKSTLEFVLLLYRHCSISPPLQGVSTVINQAVALELETLNGQYQAHTQTRIVTPITGMRSISNLGGTKKRLLEEVKNVGRGLLLQLMEGGEKLPTATPRTYTCWAEKETERKPFAHSPVQVPRRPISDSFIAQDTYLATKAGARLKREYWIHIHVKIFGRAGRVNGTYQFKPAIAHKRLMYYRSYHKGRRYIGHRTRSLPGTSTTSTLSNFPNETDGFASANKRALGRLYDCITDNAAPIWHVYTVESSDFDKYPSRVILPKDSHAEMGYESGRRRVNKRATKDQARLWTEIWEGAGKDNSVDRADSPYERGRGYVLQEKMTE
ncbi:ribonucleotide reductase [Mycena vitilis]|nr:ribonucleotide reductase [Mycena vitilis]